MFPSCCLVGTWLLFCWLFLHPLESDHVHLAILLLKATFPDASGIVLFQLQVPNWYLKSCVEILLVRFMGVAGAQVTGLHDRTVSLVFIQK